MKTKKDNSRLDFVMKKSILSKSKRSQNEIIGFAVIIVIVAVVGLVFLSLSIGRGDVIKKTSIETSDFLQSSMHYTSNCTIDYVPNYKNIQDLIKSCYRTQKCMNLLDGNDKMACEVLQETYGEIISYSFQVSDDAKNKAYKLNIYYEEIDAENNEYIMNFTEGNFGNCSSEAGASQEIFFDPGQIVVELDFCYG
jgi:hypothetical protein